MVKNNEKPANFLDILYCLNAIFLWHVFEALNNVFKYSKTMRKEYTKAHADVLAQIKELGEIFLMV